MSKQNLTPPEMARRYGVATAKVIDWIRAGELVALNLARAGCTRPRYSITPQAIEQFEELRRVVPDGGLSTTQRLRRRARARPEAICLIHPVRFAGNKNARRLAGRTGKIRKDEQVHSEHTINEVEPGITSAPLPNLRQADWCLFIGPTDNPRA